MAARLDQRPPEARSRTPLLAVLSVVARLDDSKAATSQFLSHFQRDRLSQPHLMIEMVRDLRRLPDWFISRSFCATLEAFQGLFLASKELRHGLRQLASLAGCRKLVSMPTFWAPRMSHFVGSATCPTE